MAEEIRAEIVATILEVSAPEGTHVEAGGEVVVLESMKMEIPVLAEHAGTIIKLVVHAGDVVQEGDLLAVVG